MAASDDIVCCLRRGVVMMCAEFSRRGRTPPGGVRKYVETWKHRSAKFGCSQDSHQESLQRSIPSVPSLVLPALKSVLLLHPLLYVPLHVFGPIFAAIEVGNHCT